MDPRTRRVAADGSGELDDQFRWATQRAIEDDDVPTAQVDRAVARIDELSRAHKVRAKRLVADEKGNAIRLIDDLDDANLDRMLQMDDAAGYSGFSDWLAWRQNLARDTARANPEDVNQYVRDVHRAGQSDVISNEEGLVRKLANDDTEFTGQRGEASSTIRYADEVDGVSDVTVEPGNDQYDLVVTRNGRKEFVEVKTRVAGEEIGFLWASEKLDDVSDKLSRGKDDPDIDVSKGNSYMDVQSSLSDSELGPAQKSIERAIATRKSHSEVPVDEVRLYPRDDAPAVINPDDVDPA